MRPAHRRSVAQFATCALRKISLGLGAALLLCLGTVRAGESDGILLIAKPEMRDPIFAKTVVLVLHESEGPVGVVLNRPLGLRLSAVFEDDERLRNSNERLNFGGPLRDRSLVFVFRATAPEERALPAFDDIYLSKDPDLLRELLQRPEPLKDLRVFAGYAGWAPGQLEAEVKRGDWLTLPPEAEIVFSRDAASMWPNLLQRASSRSVNAPSSRRLPVVQFP